jgi:hypothetical protein
MRAIETSFNISAVGQNNTRLTTSRTIGMELLVRPQISS